MALKLKWKVSPSPSGHYRSFQLRGWPHAEYKDGHMAAMITSESEYIPENVRKGNHSELTVYIADYSVTSWRWRMLKKKCATLAEAKQLAVNALTVHFNFQPNRINSKD